MRHAFLIVLPLALLVAQPAAPQAPTAINVQLASFKFTPNTILLDHGHSYVLRLQNVADGGHDFTAPDFFIAANVAAEDRRLVTEGEVEVPAGQVREIHLTAPGAAGSYKLKCSHSFHKMFGMSGTIVVR
jgi:uncharacterized cupredoxin-like copper-binding protein